MTSSNSQVREAYQECRRLARRHYENFPVASYLVPRSKRDAVAAIYAFARYADDIADEPEKGDQSARLAALGAWRDKLNDCYAGRAVDPVFVALRHAAEQFHLSREHFEDLIRAFESDVKVSRHPNFESLLAYCRCSANPVGRLVLELFDHREPELFELSDKICTALQLTNFWQDVRIDCERDRIYLPADDLARFGYSLDDLRAHAADARWTELMKFECERTRRLFEDGKALPERVVPELRRQLRLTWLGGTSILSRIEAAEYDVFRHRPSLHGADFLRLYLRARSPLLAGVNGSRPTRGTAISNGSRRRRLTDAKTTNFYYSFLFLSPEKRKGIEAVYAFARRGDDLVDGDLTPQQAAVGIADYRRMLDSCYHEGNTEWVAKNDADAEALEALREAIRRFKIPRQYFDDLIAGFEMDLQANSLVRYATYEELERYCYHVAGTIGLISIEIFGYRRKQAREYAQHLGAALQLVNILRDVESDAQRGRIYLPKEDLEGFSVQPEDILQKRYSPAFVRLMEFEAGRAQKHFEIARQNLAPEDGRSMIAAEIMGAIYWRILARIRARSYNVFGERVRLSRAEKFWTALSVYLGADWLK
ncbi:MAG: squalene synthase HpnC [Deltaproteobacteria bacterium]